jgi:hypothetical protein
LRRQHAGLLQQLRLKHHLKQRAVPEEVPALREEALAVKAQLVELRRQKQEHKARALELKGLKAQQKAQIQPEIDRYGPLFLSELTRAEAVGAGGAVVGGGAGVAMAKKRCVVCGRDASDSERTFSLQGRFVSDLNFSNTSNTSNPDESRLEVCNHCSSPFVQKNIRFDDGEIYLVDFAFDTGRN